MREVYIKYMLAKSLISTSLLLTSLLAPTSAMANNNDLWLAHHLAHNTEALHTSLSNGQDAMQASVHATYLSVSQGCGDSLNTARLQKVHGGSSWIYLQQGYIYTLIRAAYVPVADKLNKWDYRQNRELKHMSQRKHNSAWGRLVKVEHTIAQAYRRIPITPDSLCAAALSWAASAWDPARRPEILSQINNSLDGFYAAVSNHDQSALQRLLSRAQVDRQLKGYMLDNLWTQDLQTAISLADADDPLLAG